MAAQIEQVQSVDGGWGLNVKDNSGRRWMTLIYATRAEANATRKQIEAATANAVSLVIAC